jgi:hypothetical protein
VASNAMRARQAATVVCRDARDALANDAGDGRRWTYLTLLELVAVEAISEAGLDAHLSFEWDEHAITYTRAVMLHADARAKAVLRRGYIVEPPPGAGRGMTRVWLGGPLRTRPASRMLDAEVPSWTSKSDAACSAP